MVEGGGHRQDEGVFLLLQAGVTTQPGQEAVGRVCVWTWGESEGRPATRPALGAGGAAE